MVSTRQLLGQTPRRYYSLTPGNFPGVPANRGSAISNTPGHYPYQLKTREKTNEAEKEGKTGMACGDGMRLKVHQRDPPPADDYPPPSWHGMAWHGMAGDCNRGVESNTWEGECGIRAWAGAGVES